MQMYKQDKERAALLKGVYTDTYTTETKRKRDEVLRRTDVFLSLALLMALILRAYNHYFAVSFNDFALIAHRLY